MYNVVEKFVSINGESKFAGQLAVFIRFRGCNLNCVYCDTKWANTADDHGKPNTYGRSFMLRMNLFKS